MLGRAVLPLRRLQPALFPARATLLSTSFRTLSSRVNAPDPHKPPRPASTRRSPATRQQVPPIKHDTVDEASEIPLKEETQLQYDRARDGPLVEEQYTSIEREDGQRLEGQTVRVERDPSITKGFPTPPPSAEPEEPQYQQKLPDLTQGIPSTLAEELKEAQSKRGPSPASLNITEEPAEEVPSSGGSGRREPPSRPEYVSTGDRKRSKIIWYTYAGITLGSVAYLLYLGRTWSEEEQTQKYATEIPNDWNPRNIFARGWARLGSTTSYYTDPVTTKLLPDEPADPMERYPFVLVISLEDMLVHADWTRDRGWRIAKRPGVDYFLRYLSQYFEIVLFTSQPSAVADQVLRKLDPYSVIRWPLFREATLYKDGGYVKDLSYLNRDLKKVIVMDTVPHHVMHQPENAIVIPKWKGDPADQTLVQFIPFLEYLATMGFDDTRKVLKSFEGKNIPIEFARREKLLREKFEAQEAEKRSHRPKRGVSFGSLMGSKNSDGSTGGSKMLWDEIRERGQKQYEDFEKRIREEGPKWLAEREAEEKKAMDEAMKNYTSGFFGGVFGGSPKTETK